MRIVMIGGTGDIGTYFVPHPVYVGNEVIVISRGKSNLANATCLGLSLVN